MLEEACCVPLVDVQSHEQEEMHTSTLSCLERLRDPTEDCFHLLSCDFYSSCYAFRCHCRRSLTCCHRPTGGFQGASHIACVGSEDIPRIVSLTMCACMHASLSCMLTPCVRQVTKRCCHVKSESCWKSPGRARLNTSFSQSCNSRSRHANTQHTILSQSLFRTSNL